MIKNFCQTYKTEAHAETKKAPRAGNVGYSTHLLRFSESFGVGLLDENVYDGKITFCIIVNFTFNGQCKSFVRYSLSPPSEIRNFKYEK